jgi:hypothetical protein
LEGRKDGIICRVAFDLLVSFGFGFGFQWGGFGRGDRCIMDGGGAVF